MIMRARLFLFVMLMYLFPLLFDPLADALQSPLHCHEDERSALLELKQSFYLDKYSNSSCLVSWNLAAGGQEGGNCCAWDRIECDGQSGHVIGLDLSGCRLHSASLNSSSSLFRLTHLEKLNLTGNRFNDSIIPSAIGDLMKLKVLDLSSSDFSGQVPPEILGLTNLSSLILSYNYDLQLKKPNLEDLVRSLTKLEELHLDGVNISAPLTGMLANLSSLKSLTLSGCSLQGVLPPAISKLPNLQVLDVSYNKGLSNEFSTSLDGFASLRELDMSFCNFSGMIPAFLSNCTKLSILWLSYNRFHGQLPSFVNLNQLTELYLYVNELTGEIPYSIGSLALLQKLDLSYNQLTGPIPSSLGFLTRLESLVLIPNQLSGPIPSSLGNLIGLGSLDLSSNQLSDPIPSSLGNLTRLKSLDLSSNKLSGPIPSFLGNLSRLRSLELSSNQLSGSIPSSLGNLTGLELLDLSSNKLSGPIPSSLGNLTWLESLYLSSNQLSGPIPSSLGNLTWLESLYLSSNQLSGPIPSSLGNLTWLDLSSNQLTGQISDELLTTFLYLNLSHNQLTGNVPDFLGRVEEIGFIDLRFNRLQGPFPIPARLTFSYQVSNNQFFGDISPLICNVVYMKVLDLAKNNFSGFIPPCLGNLSLIRILNLHDNNFSGVIPDFYGDQCALNMMDFSRNRLEGPLPQSLVNCTKLEYLNFKDNLINDKFPSWLGSLSSLRVLILRNNRFHGEIVKPRKGDCGFPSLQIFDISHNNFSGSLPSSYFMCWNAMQVSSLNGSDYLGHYITNGNLTRDADVSFYDYSMEMINKGTDLVYPKIFIHFAALDLSSNNFSGGIPRSLGSLQELHLLNLSHNLLIGHIPYALSNLTQLEALDLSYNMLSGNIPYQLTGLAFLSFFNVSYNQLSGPIPRGPQFNTFKNNSYIRNPGLCGDPLSKKCSGRQEEPPLPSQDDHSDPDTPFEFDWKIILMGFASGVVIGVILGQRVRIGRDNWFVRKCGRRDRTRHR